MERRYQVFVSSTYEDLREERQEVMQALLELDCIPSGMELFPAADDDQWTLIKRVIDDCDYYMVIIAGRYGSLGPDGTSYTQMEYEYAVAKSKPVIAFLHHEIGKIPSDKTDPKNQEKLQRFRELAHRKMCKSWATPQELGSVVSRSIVRLIKDKPGIGWVRANHLPDESAAQEILKLRNTISELEKKLADLASSVPAGTEGLAQGDESITLHFAFQTPDNNLHHREAFTITWNKLLAVVGPLLLGRASDLEIKGKLEEAFRNRSWDERQRKVYSINIRDEDYQIVKVQLRALGLITKISTNSDAKPFWTLTPYGDALMNQIAAIRVR